MSLPRILAFTALTLLVTTACGDSENPKRPGDNTSDGGSNGGADSGVPATGPGAPTTVTATAGDRQATVSWLAPSSNGGSPITGYTVVPSPGGASITVNAGSLSATVTGLTNGTAYTFRIFATTSVGRGPDSAPSNPVTPATVPGAPTEVSASGGNAQATVSWLAPANTGGIPVTGYTVTVSPDGTQVSVGAGTLSTVVTGLTNSASYTFRVSASNAMGHGPDSASSNAVTPATVPGAPTQVSATGGNAQATVSWLAPSSTGGSALTGYTVIASPGGSQVSVGSGSLSATLTGLSNGTAYTFTVFATNAVGQGPGSGPSNSVTPATVPGAPSQVSALGGNAQATVSWLAPASNGGSALTGYTVVTSPGGAQVSVGAGSLSATVSGLSNGTAYTFTVFATNGVGQGPSSLPSNSVTPATVPGAPTQVSATSANAQATVSWQAPASNGGSPLTGYTVVTSPGGAQVSVGAGSLSATVSGLSNGTAYTFTVFATNAVGRGPDSAPSNSVTPSAVPGAPTQVSATGGNAQATVTWLAPANTGGSPLTGYTVTASPGGAQRSVAGNVTSVTFTGLSNGTSYTFVVAAQNAQGLGPASAPSNPVVPATVPAAPTQVSATPSEAGAVVTWAAPLDNGGAALTGYRLTSNPAAVQLTVGAASTSAQLTGLASGTAYTFTVQALNAVGASVPSSPSNAVTPLQRVQIFIGFDNLANGTVVTNQYPQLTLSSDAGRTNTTLNLASTFNTSVPNILCTQSCVSPTYIDFTRPARDVKLKAVGVNDTGKAFAVLVHRQGQPVTRLEYTGQGQTYVPLPVDLSALGDITRVELVEITDGYGVGWDDFSFSTLQ